MTTSTTIPISNGTLSSRLNDKSLYCLTNSSTEIGNLQSATVISQDRLSVVPNTLYLVSIGNGFP